MLISVDYRMKSVGAVGGAVVGRWTQRLSSTADPEKIVK